jgi:ribonuclease Z
MDQRSNRCEELDVDAVVASALSRLRVANEEGPLTEETKDTPPHSSGASSAPSLLFLGTGSAEPSKYRGSSGVLVKLPGLGGTTGPGTGTGTGGDGGYALLDCGEGVAGATRRFLGDDEGVRVLDELKFVFITHHHPDHMAGLLGVLAARSKRAPPLPVLGPSATARWLRRAVEVGAVGEGPKGTWTKSARDVDDGVARLAAFTRTASLYARENGGGGPFWIPPKNNGGVQNVQNVLSPEGTPMTASVPPRFPPPPRSIGIPIPIPIPPPPPPPPPTLPPLPPPRHPLCLSLGLSRLEAVPVEHCPEASAVILAHKSGFSLCYSGDCRPSRRLASAARGVQVLVHEATFADDLSSHALRKRHSTVSEALRVAKRRQRGSHHPHALLAAVPQGARGESRVRG